MVGAAICRALSKYNYNHQLKVNRKDLDLSDQNAVELFFLKEKPSVVILAAAKVGGIEANRTYPTEYLLENLKIQTSVIESAWKFGVRRLLFLGSSCIYPREANQPITEEELLKGELEKTNESYAIAKIAGLRLCSALRKQYKFDAISLMPTNLYGPGDNYHPKNSHVLPSLIRKFYMGAKGNQKSVVCWGTGSPLREFLHVEDLGEACVFALEQWNPDAINAPLDKDGKPLNHLNVGTGIDISIKDLTVLLANITGFNGNIEWDTTKPDGTFRKLLDVSRLRNLGWNASINLEEGLKKSLVDFEENYSIDNLRNISSKIL